MPRSRSLSPGRRRPGTRIYRSRRADHVTVERINSFEIRFKLYQLLLIIIMTSLMYRWYVTIFSPKVETEDSTKLDTTDGKIIGFLYFLGELITEHAVEWFMSFISLPFNITLLMLCTISRILFNFVTFIIILNWSEIICRYEIDKGFKFPRCPGFNGVQGIPTIEITPPPVDV
ncbi:unnamed protein product [Caenorhabditis brenneri]